MSALRERLVEYLSKNRIDSPIAPITPDASTREYFRFFSEGMSRVACVYPDEIKHAAHAYVDVTSVFLRNDLPVAELVDFDEVLGVVVVEDLGDKIMRNEFEKLSDSERDKMVRKAIDLIVRIQGSTDTASESNSICSRLKFDVEKLMWELNYFKIHYFTTFKKEPLLPEIDAELNAEFVELSNELELKAAVLCHRDFHAANLMIGAKGQLRIIDHQDARLGSPAYDLVSLLLDRVVDIPSEEWLGSMIEHFHSEREKAGLESLDRDLFQNEFKLQTIQRCLKATGTFAFQSASRGKTYFVPYIQPMFQIVTSNTIALDRFPAIRRIIAAEQAN